MHIEFVTYKCAEIGVVEYSTPGGVNIEHLKADQRLLYWLNSYNFGQFKQNYLSLRLTLKTY